jgi:hypothetical protein
MACPSIRDKAREVVRTGKLPTRRPDRVWGGRGDGAECSICNARVKHDELEFELEFIWGEDERTHHMHLDCFAAWERERDNVRPAQDELERSA